jgi:hypothetical protein
MAVALLALFVALGGSASAIVISGKTIKNNSVTGTDLKNHSIKGRDVARNTLGGDTVKESKLGKVPKAKQAETVGGLSATGLLSVAKLKCPVGTIAHAGACPEKTLRGPAVTYDTAIQACAADDRRLIGLDEAVSLRRRQPALNVGTELTTELLDFDQIAVTNATGAPQSSSLFVGIGSGRRTTSTAQFRCVAPMSN